MNPPANSPADPQSVEARLQAAWPTAAWSDVNVVVAVSGGADSVALLRAMQRIKDRCGGNGRLFVAHVNHHLRGQQSDKDQAWLDRQCRQLKLPLLCREADVAAAASVDGDGLEAAARKVRYQMLGEMAESVGARCVAVAHHRDDQVETVLFRLIRGAGLRGLAGMRPFRPLTPSVSLVRPLLNCTRDELRDYLVDLNQSFRNDPSNADVTIKRNRLRQEVLTVLRQHFNHDVDAAICRTSDQLAAAGDVVDQVAGDLAVQCGLEIGADGGASMDVAPLAEQIDFLSIEAVRFAWREAGLPEQGMAERHWTSLLELVASPSEARLQLPGGVQASIAGGRLRLRRV